MDNLKENQGKCLNVNAACVTQRQSNAGKAAESEMTACRDEEAKLFFPFLTRVADGKAQAQIWQTNWTVVGDVQSRCDTLSGLWRTPEPSRLL